MSDEQQILVILEPDIHPREVVERAAWIAGLNGFGVTLLWCDPDVGPLGAPIVVSNEARDILEEILELVRTANRRTGLPLVSPTGLGLPKLFRQEALKQLDPLFEEIKTDSTSPPSLKKPERKQKKRNR